jgi:hypothetical protein
MTLRVRATPFGAILLFTMAATAAAACGYEPPGATELTAGNGDAPPNANNEPGKPKPGDPVNAEGASGGADDDRKRDDDQEGGASKQGGVPGVLCDRKKPFNAPSAASGLPAGEHLSTPHLAFDELTIYFTISGTNGIAKLGRATRPTINAPFVPDTALAALASPNNSKDNDPSESADQLSLWFSSERNGQADLFFSTRANPKEAFGAPQLVPVVNNGGAADTHPYFRTRAQELWFSSQRTGPERSIFVALKGPTGFQAPILVKELGTNVRHPMVTEDGLDILFDAPDRPGGKGGTDLFTAHRDSTGLPFTNLTPLASINSPASEFAGWISPDGCRIYFSSDREQPNRHRIFVASR